jgi:ABC-type lipoprotein release transport system permease subunit
MNSEIVVGSLSLVGTLLGSGLGVLASAKLTNYRIAQLEKKVDEHNGYGKKNSCHSFPS